ncbi:MAG: AAA family ATPase [Desulfurococcales archaeon]|nr:AAA family ATPase [Desulfurococcales archaeon]
MIIIITGTPGTGKTTVSRLISRELNCTHIDVSALVEEMKWGEPDPTGRETLVLTNIEELIQYVGKINKNRECVIVDTHYPGIFDSLAKDIMAVFVLRTHPKIIARRLIERKWGAKKIAENAEAELLGVIENEALRRFKCVISIDTTNKNASEVSQSIKTLIEQMHQTACPVQGRTIDWINDESAVDAVLNIEKGQS